MKKLILSTALALSLITSAAIASPLLSQQDYCSSNDVCVMVKTDGSIPDSNPVVVNASLFGTTADGEQDEQDQSFLLSTSSPGWFYSAISDLNEYNVTDMQVTLTDINNQAVSGCAIDLKAKSWSAQRHTILVSKTATGYQCQVN